MSLIILGREVFRYGIVGLLSSATHFLSALYAIEILLFSPMVGNLGAFASGVLVSYLGNTVWTFGHRRGATFFSGQQRFIRYLLMVTCGFFYNAIGMLLLSERTDFEPITCIFLIVVSWPAISFLLCRYWIFKVATLS
ncbi:MAG: hypothetical protein B0D91_10520 [Oceanospirillales bacterium LUC14_002_19_P2]|nr:MAG: hypothetical protein B0D91_10520 [Oceanospirillales bacterium LUC14_002_19_P2]